MNLLQIARQARLEVDAIRTGGTTSALWSDEEVYSAINTALESAYRVFRLAQSEAVAKTILSTAAAADYITESYAGSSLQIVSGTVDYTLPPDFVSVLNIRPVTSGFDGITFSPLRSSQKLYVEQRSIPNTDLGSVNGGDMTYFYLIIGARTLRIVPTPQDTIDIELMYNYQPSKLMVYSTGTVGNGGVSQVGVTGTTTTWVDVGLKTPAELVLGAVATAVDLGLYYPTISTITSNTALTLAKARSITDASVYRIAMVPQIPIGYHAWLAQMSGAILYRKVSIEVSDASRKTLEAQLMSEITPEVSQRQMQDSVPVEPYETP